jgi:hypothetical protein
MILLPAKLQCLTCGKNMAFVITDMLNIELAAMSAADFPVNIIALC